MTDADLTDELGQAERPQLEFKSDPNDRDAVRRAITALANDLGEHGTSHLLIGVDKTGRPSGVDVSDETLLKIANIRNEGKILPIPIMSVDRRPFDGVPCIAVRIEPSPSPPVTLDGTVWVRTGPTTRKATKDEERVLSEKRRARDRPFDERPIYGASLTDLDLELFRSTYLPAAVALDVLEENERPIEHHLAALRLIDPASETPTALGLLVVGLDPTAFLPGAYLQFVRYQGDDESAPIADDEELRSNFVGQLQTLDRFIRANVRTAVVNTATLRQAERPEYPHAALREVVLNAFAHRNYESSNAPISMRWYDHRLEVTSPGGPFGAVNRENFFHRNDYRNPGLAAALKHLGYVNRFGRGISLIRQQLESNGNPPAEFEIDDAWWSVTVRSAA